MWEGATIQRTVRPPPQTLRKPDSGEGKVDSKKLEAGCPPPRISAMVDCASVFVTKNQVAFTVTDYKIKLNLACRHFSGRSGRVLFRLRRQQPAPRARVRGRAS
eukprot:SAG31_NODE_10193_length_1172_cov_1.453868_1_plen_103_part_01